MYIDKPGFVARFGQTELTQLERLRPNAFDESAADADGEIHSFIAGRYAIPVSPVPARLVAVAADIARYRMYDDQAKEEVRQRYEDALRWLRDVCNGKAVLVDDLGNELAGPEEGGATIKGGSRSLLFTPGLRACYETLDPRNAG